MKKLVLFVFMLPILACGQIKIPLKNKTAGGNSLFFPLATKATPNQPSFVITIPGIGQILNGIIAYNLLNIPAGTTRVSLGVFNQSGNLVRTLASGIPPSKILNGLQWDGKLDDGTNAPLGTYTVNVLSNNVQYTWEGVIGNTSTDLTGDYVIKALPLSMAFIGTTGYAAIGYSEHGSAQKSFSTANPNKWTSGYYTETTQSSERVCTDGNIVYYAGGNYFSNDYWVYGTYPADNLNPKANMVQFSAGVQENNNDASGSSSYNYAVSVTKGNPAAAITAICVQKNGNYLFVSRNGINQLQILSKTTGSLLQTMSLTGVQGVACDNSYLYAISNNSLQKYSVSGSNTSVNVTNTNTSFAGLTNPYCIAISPDNSTLAVGDWSTQQVRFYSTSGAALNYTLGQPNAYANSPYVANDKFLRITFLAYQPDGKLWVGDALKNGGTAEQSGNNNHRILLFDVNRSYVNQVATLNYSRSTSADLNNPTRVFGDFLEYERDYSKPLDNGTNGSWKLKANWGVNITDFDVYDKFRQVITMSNGRTYAICRRNSSYVFDIYELTSTGARLTSLTTYGYIGSDGTLVNTYDSNGQKVVTKQPLTGFNGSNNPVWSNPTIFVTSPTYGYYDPVGDPTYGINGSSDKYVFFSHSGPAQSSTDNPTIGYHLGLIPSGGNAYSWKASRSTRTDYYGDYPNNGDWDIGNGWCNTPNCNSQHSLTHAMVNGSNIFFNANGEFWKGSQVNIWNHFNENGLFIGQFGITGQKAALTGNTPAMMAGNAYGTAEVKVGNDVYIYHCDESYHAGIHSWKVTGLNTIAVQKINLGLQAAINLVADVANLMNGLSLTPKSGLTNAGGWVTEGSAAFNTGYNQYLPDSTDVQLAGSGSQVLKRQLTTSTNLNSWKLTGGINEAGGQPTLAASVTDNTDQFSYLELIDNTGKIIARFCHAANSGQGYYPFTFLNTTTIAEGSAAPLGLRDINRDFSFVYSGNSLTFKIGSLNAVTVTTPFESGANMKSPAYIRIRQGGSQYHAMDLYKVRFSLQ